MKLNYAPKWEIEDRRVRRLDEKRVELNKLYSLLFSQRIEGLFPYQSIETIKMRQSLMECMEKEICKISNNHKTPEGFDKIVLDDIAENVKKARAEDDFFHNTAKNPTLGILLSNLFGKRAYTRILDLGKNKEYHKALHRYSEAIHELFMTSLDSELILESPNFRSIKRKVVEIIKGYKSKIDKFYQSLGIYSGSSKYNIEVASANMGFSYWDGTNLVMVLDPNKLRVFKEHGEVNYQISRAEALHIGIHEAAHALEDLISEASMPKGLHYDIANFSRISHGPVCEGVALLSEVLGIRWMRKNKRKLGIEDRDLKIAELAEQAYIPKKVQAVIHSILELKEFEGLMKNRTDSFHAEAHKLFLQRTGLKRITKDNYMFDDLDFDEILLHLSYIVGSRRMNKLAENLSTHINMKTNLGKGLMLQALMTGAWSSPECQERFILEHFIPQARKDSRTGLITDF